MNSLSNFVSIWLMFKMTTNSLMFEMIAKAPATRVQNIGDVIINFEDPLQYEFKSYHENTKSGSQNANKNTFLVMEI